MSTEVIPRVAAHGLSTAAIFFLGGYPLNDDLSQGLALTGFNESVLNKFLKPVNLSLRECYRSVFIKEKLDYSGTKPKELNKALQKINVKAYEEILLEELKHVQPTVVVPLDDIALSVVYPHINQIRKPKGRSHWIYCYRGSVLPLRLDWQEKIGKEFTVRVIPTLSPQLLMADWSAQVYTHLDYKRIKENSIKRSPVEEYGKIWIAKTGLQVHNFFSRFINEKGYRRVTVDVETWYGLLTCICFCFDGYESMSVPLISTEISGGDMVLIWQYVAKVLASEDIEIEGQNFKYDWAILERHGFKVRRVVHDTNLKASLIYPELPKGLDFLTSIYCPEIPYYKDEGKAYNDKLYTRDKLYIYNGKDGLSTNKVGKEQDKELKEEGLEDLYYNEMVPSILIYKNMDETGIYIDEDVKKKLNDKYQNHYDVQLKVLRGRIGEEEFNPRSSDDVGKLVYETLKFPKRTRVNDAGETVYKTDKDTLDDLLIHYGETNLMGRVGYTIVSSIILCKKLGMTLQYINTPLHPDGHWRGVSNLGGPETGRSSSSKTIDERWRYENEPKKGNETKFTRRLGRSLQTVTKHGFSIDEDLFAGFEDRAISKDIRSMFVPHHGFVFIECDGSQAEARVVAVLANDFEMLAMFDQKPNIHKKTAGLIFSIDPNIIGKEEPYIPKIGTPYYHIGKIGRHAGNNNMKPARLSAMSHLPIHETTRILDVFHRMHPKIRGVFHKEIKDNINQTRCLVNPNGRKRTFFGRLDEGLYNEAIGNIQQGTISDLTKFTMHRVTSALDGYMSKYFFLNEAHDSTLTEVKKGFEMEYAKTFKKIYERPINFLNCSLSRDFDLVIPCEISGSALNWMDVADPKNEIVI